MAGRGRVPKDPANRQRRNLPARGEWHCAPGIGWPDAALPDPPDGLMPASKAAWQAWMTSWIAAHWTPADMPGLRQVIRLYDQVERGAFQRASELRLSMDTYGITPKGRQDRRWLAPPDAPQPDAPERSQSRYSHLRVTD